MGIDRHPLPEETKSREVLPLRSARSGLLGRLREYSIWMWLIGLTVIVFGEALAGTSAVSRFAPGLSVPANTASAKHPAPTPIIDTAPGTVLEVGKEWRTEGMWVSLDEVTWLPFDGQVEPVGLNVVIRNNTGMTLTTSTNSADWTVTDNLGKRYRLRHAADKNEDWQATIVPPGLDVEIFLLKADIRDVLDPEWFRLTIPELGRVKNATWQFRIPR